MISSIHYIIRSRRDGSYLTARVRTHEDEPETQYLLVFQEDFEALSYLNTFASELAPQFAVESLSANQLKGVIQRWGFKGIGMVKDPLEPRIQFMLL